MVTVLNFTYKYLALNTPGTDTSNMVTVLNFTYKYLALNTPGTDTSNMVTVLCHCSQLHLQVPGPKHT